MICESKLDHRINYDNTKRLDRSKIRFESLLFSFSFAEHINQWPGVRRNARYKKQRILIYQACLLINKYLQIRKLIFLMTIEKSFSFFFWICMSTCCYWVKRHVLISAYLERRRMWLEWNRLRRCCKWTERRWHTHTHTSCQDVNQIKRREGAKNLNWLNEGGTDECVHTSEAQSCAIEILSCVRKVSRKVNFRKVEKQIDQGSVAVVLFREDKWNETKTTC